MKQSLFNNFIILSGDKILGYNAFTRRFAVLSKEVADRLVSSEDFSDSEMAKSHTLSLLKDAGFIIPSDFDEVAILDNEIEHLDFNPTYLQLHVNPTLNCNFRCWYCYEEHQPASELGPDIFSALQNHISLVVKDPVRLFLLGFFGGEPLLKFRKVCKPLIEWSANLCRQRDVNFKVNFTTNSYLLTDEIINFLGGYDCCLQITLDGHRPLHNKVRFPAPGIGSYDRILTNVAKLAEKGVNVILRINYTLDNIRSVGEIVSDLADKNITRPHKIAINFQRVWQDRRNGGDEEIKRLILSYGKELESLGMTYSMPSLDNPRSNSCYGDSAGYLCVNYNGDFFKCTARDFKSERRAGHLAADGTLVWETGRKEQWEKAKFSNPVCRSCRIAPLCLGGCRQRGIETPHNGMCPMEYDGDQMDDLILQRFESQYMLSPLATAHKFDLLNI